MSDPYTPTRQMAQSASQKAGDAFARASRADERVAAAEARVELLERQVAELREYLWSAAPRAHDGPKSRRKAA